ncbi:hypothetical protein BOTBODRAFT_551020 [Botryobasidium botryosum FD-172 SS1]|uniref:Kinetochore protein Nuf2 N-terminal domain-containing protein n=1 Tax=Botryobasidium botryosum (strain FD-172 SS1) TaxID=930990 RepID=A0A067N2X0_BOTB1|nr:hypothetical protein BOTBODRAFT_551020 [Botryobasidium botryosum FD-172 SS1]
MDNPSYAFPLISIPDLIEIITEWGIPVSEEDLAKPSAALVQNIYLVLLNEMAGIDISDIEAPRQILLNDLDYPDYYIEALTLQMLHYHIGRLAKVARIESFTMQDLTRPEGLRTRKILSGIHNVMLCMQQHDEVLEKTMKKSQEAPEREAQLEYELEQIRSKLDELAYEREAEKPQIQELQVKLRELSIQFPTLNKEVLALQEQNETLRKERNALKHRLVRILRRIQPLLISYTFL